MELSISRQQLGLILTVLGTAAMGFSLRTQGQYEGDAVKAVKKAKQKHTGLFVPTETHIIRPLFWGGLGLVALGAILQW